MDQTLIDRYIDYQSKFWEEIRAQLSGPLAPKAKYFPDIYKYLSNCLVIQTEDGIVSVGFYADIKLKEPKFSNWLTDVPPDNRPQYKPIDVSFEPDITFLQWVQIFSGNGMKIVLDHKKPPDIILPLFLTDFPQSGIKTLWVTPTAKEVTKVDVSFREALITDLTTGEILYPFRWQQLEIFGNQTIRLLTRKDPILEANKELITILGGLNLGLTKAEMSKSPTNPVIEKMEELIEDYEQLLNDKSNEEEQLHIFLNDHPILLAPDYIDIKYKPRFGAEYIPDFILVQASDYDEKCTLIEIEPASTKLFTNSGDPTAELNHSLTQVDNWRTWLKQNARYGQESLGLKNLHSECKAMVIIGRKSQINKEMKKNFERLTLKVHHQTEIFTYDDLLDRSKRWVENLKELTL